jgi:GNAT superfamily N-acetyltransferase
MNRPEIMVRPAHIRDADVLARFSAAMAWETERRRLDMEQLKRGTLAVFEAPERGMYLVAEHRDKQVVVGQTLITYEWSDWRNGQFWWIQSVYVDPPWRRQGVYRVLHESVLAAARAREGVCGLRLYVEKENTVAQSVYEAVNLHRTSYEIWEVDFVL